MSSIDTTQQTGGTGAVSGAPAVNPSSEMNESSFLQLLVAQLKYQDPMSPTDNQQFIQEQAQFSTVEGLTNLETTLKEIETGDQMSQSTNLIGTNVDYTASDGSVASGLVSSVSNADGAITLQIGSANVAPSAILKVSLASDAQGAGTGG